MVLYFPDYLYRHLIIRGSGTNKIKQILESSPLKKLDNTCKIKMIYTSINYLTQISSPVFSEEISKSLLMYLLIPFL